MQRESNNFLSQLCSDDDSSILPVQTKRARNRMRVSLYFGIRAMVVNIDSDLPQGAVDCSKVLCFKPCR